LPARFGDDLTGGDGRGLSLVPKMTFQPMIPRFRIPSIDLRLGLGRSDQCVVVHRTILEGRQAITLDPGRKRMHQPILLPKKLGKFGDFGFRSAKTGPSVGKTSALTRSKTSTFVRPAKFSPRRASCLTMGRHYTTELRHAIAAAASSRRSAVQSCRC